MMDLLDLFSVQSLYWFPCLSHLTILESCEQGNFRRKCFTCVCFKCLQTAASGHFSFLFLIVGKVLLGMKQMIVCKGNVKVEKMSFQEPYVSSGVIVGNVSLGQMEK